MSDRVIQWIRADIRAIDAYHVPPAEGMIKLDAMENPNPWPGDLAEDWLARLRQASVNRYPDPGARVLAERLREHLGIPDGQSLLFGNGSDELIQVIMMAIAEPGRVVMGPEPSFVMYRMIAQFLGLEYVGVPLTEQFGLDLARCSAAIDEHHPAVIFLAYPNNPTGNLFDEEDVLALIHRAPGLVVIDEAYHAFARQTFLHRICEFDNVVVMRTLSKSGLAGLRFGFMVGADPWIREFDKLRLPYNVNSLTQQSVTFALEHAERMDRQCAAIVAERGRVMDALRQDGRFRVHPSDANFVLFHAQEGMAEDLFRHLLARNILIKRFGHAEGPLKDALRVTIGLVEENDAFLAAVADWEGGSVS
ncbi:MAG: histidinol-phosphate transaminase [Halothiobacillaceae bacterium]